MTENHQIINDWIKSGISDGLVKDNTLIDTLFSILDNIKSDEQLLEPICDKLFEWYRSQHKELRTFSLIFIPSLIDIHLISCSHDKRKYQCVDILLVGIYNLSIVDSDGQPITRTIRVPNLLKPSVYHEPSQHSSSSQPSSQLTEHAVSKLDSNTTGDISLTVFGPYSEIEQIIASNRMEVLSVLLRIYHENISSFPKQSYVSLCRMCLRVTAEKHVNISEKINFTKITDINYLMEIMCKNPLKTYPISSQFLVQLTNCIYFALFNGVFDIATQALDQIHRKAVDQLYCDVLLMTNAIRSSSLIDPVIEPIKRC